MIDERQHYYVSTIPTREHLEMAFVAVGKKTGTSAWYITDDPSKAFDFGNDVESRKVVSILRGEHDEQDLVYMFGADPEKRICTSPPCCPGRDGNGDKES
jgi:thymidine phosphorylase